MTVEPFAPQGAVPAINIPNSQDYPRLVFTAPYFETVPLAELIAPAVTEAVEAQLPSLVPPFVDQAAQDAVNQLAVLLAGSTMQGPLYLNPVMPTQDSQAASKAYVDSLLATAGIPEVPPTPIGQVWGRETGQWVPISQSGGTYLPLAGGTMQGQINMSGNAIVNLPALPVMPNGAAPAQWVLNQIASVSLYQGTWDIDTYVPDLTQLSTHVNGYTWIAITTSPSGVVIGPPIPGLQGQTVFNGDTVIYSATAGVFQSIHSGGLTLPEAQALFLPFTGGQMSGALLLNANATQPTQATTLQQVETLTAGFISPEAPTDGQGYLRIGATRGWTPGLPLTGGVTTGAILLSGNASNALQAVPYQQLVSYTQGLYMPLAGGTMVGPIVLAGNATAPLNPITLTQLNSMLGSYLPLAGGTLTGGLAIGGTNNALTVSGGITSGGGISVGANVWQILGASHLWNVNAANGSYVAAGAAAAIGLASGTQGLLFSMAAVGTPGATPSYVSALALQPNGNAVFGGDVSVPGTVYTSLIGATASPAYTSTINDLHVGNASGGAALWVDVIRPQFASFVDCLSDFHSEGALWCGGVNWYDNAGYMACGASLSVWSIAVGNQTAGAQNYWAVNAGYMYCYSSVMANAFVDSSDPQVKTNVSNYTEGVSIISQMQPINFQYNGLGGTQDDVAAGVTRIGFDASQVQPLVPQAVMSSQGKLRPDDTETVTLLTITPTMLIPVLVSAIKQLINRVHALEAAASISPPAADLA